MSTARYAIYYAPPEGSALWAFGRRWFGRAERTAVMQRILPLVTLFGRAPPLHIEEICLYRQETAKHAFVIDQRFRLGPTEGRIRPRMRAWRGLHGSPSAC